MAHTAPVAGVNLPSQGGWATTAADGRLVAVDVAFAALLRATPAQLLGQPWTALVAPQSATHLADALRTLATGAPWSGHLECLAAGVLVDLRVDAYPLADPAGPALVLHATRPETSAERRIDDATQLATWQAALVPAEASAAARAVLQEIRHAAPFAWGAVLQFVAGDADDAAVLATYPTDMAGVAAGHLLSGLDRDERLLRETGEPALFGTLRVHPGDRSPLARLPAFGMQSALKIPLFAADVVTGALLLYALREQAFDAIAGVAIEQYVRPLGARLEPERRDLGSATPAAAAEPPAAPVGIPVPAPAVAAPLTGGQPAAASDAAPIDAADHADAALSADLERERLSQIGQLVSGVAHELNNPLTAILGYAQLLPALRDDDREFAIQTIEQEAIRAGRIVRNLLYFARQHRPQVEPIDLNALLTRIIDVRRYNYAVDNVVVDLHLGQIPLVPGDRYQLEQVFLNLLNNAHQALRATGGTVTVESMLMAGAARITVIDNGPGIPEPLRARIFEPFFTTHDVGEGTGLGLSIAFGIVQQHNGRLWAESPPGGGARLVVELPLTQPMSAPTDSTPATGAATAPADMRVLVVDDERAVRVLIAELLAVEGYAPLQASSGAEALAITERIPKIAAVVCDVRMPGMDGHALYREMVRRWPHMAGHFLFVTGDTLRDRASRIETERYLEKPFDAAQLHAGVRQVLGARPRITS